MSCEGLPINLLEALASCLYVDADGGETWVIITGVAEVLWKDSTTATKGRVALAADTDGRAIDVAVPSANPVVAEHFKEIGHVLEDNAGGVNQLVKCILHFN